MRSAWWCADCRQKVESCEGGDCRSVAAVLGPEDPGVERAAAAHGFPGARNDPYKLTEE